MSCGTCGIQASAALAPDTGVPPGAPTTARLRCPYCKAFLSHEGSPCRNPHCPHAVVTVGDPRVAHPAQHAGFMPGPSDVTRRVACRNPREAYLYARSIDRRPRADTRTAACQEPEYAHLYALSVDRRPRADTRTAACQDPQWAGRYALDIDRAPRDDTRQAACQDPQWAAWYARYVDGVPRADTRTAACQDPQWATWYARYVDGVPRAATRATLPATAGRWGRALRSFLYQGETFDLLAPWSCGWLDGGCRMLATALSQWLHEEATLSVLEDQAGHIQHFVTVRGDYCIDGDGVALAAVLLRRWREVEHVPVTRIRPYAGERVGTVPDNPQVVARLVTLLEQRWDRTAILQLLGQPHSPAAPLPAAPLPVLKGPR